MFRNLSHMHRSQCDLLGSEIALRYKRQDAYTELSWEEYRIAADYVAAGLIKLGVEAGTHIAILSENRYEWLIADHGILSAASINVPLHAPLTASQIEYQLSHSESQCIFVSNQSQADKVFSICEQLPSLRLLISFDEVQPPASVSKLKVLYWRELLETGRNALGSVQAEMERREAEVVSEDMATIIYTSGTTGSPKGVMLTHNNILTNAKATSEIYDITGDDHLLSWLPYSHIYARTVDHYLTSISGVTVSLAESVDTVVKNLAEVQPTWITAVPRFYEKVWASVENLPEVNRKEQLQKIFGGRIEKLTSGGAPLPSNICEAMHQSGIPILEGYGLTESSPVICFNTRKHWKIGTVGRTIPGVEVRIADDGEILTRGPHVMKGYWNDSVASANAIQEGWLHTGDVGYLDEQGFLTITDRKKELIVLSTGKNVAPSEIERLLICDPYIDQAVVYGNNRSYLTALLVLNFEMLKQQFPDHAEAFHLKNRIVYDTRLYEFTSARVAELMQQVSNPERVRKFCILSHPFTVAAEELTPTLKIRRSFVVAKYQQELHALYETDEKQPASNKQ